MNGTYRPIIDKYASAFGLDPDVVEKVMMAESGGNPDAVSPRGATGLMQLMPGTARGLGVSDLTNPSENIRGGVQYLAGLYKLFGGDMRKVLAAYNWGPGNVRKDPTLKTAPRETQNYLAKILGPSEAQAAEGNEWEVVGESPVASEQSSGWEVAGNAPVATGQEKTIGGFMSNLGSSAWKRAKEMATLPFTQNPVDIALNVGNLGLGALEGILRDVGGIDYPPLQRETAVRKMLDPFRQAIEHPTGIPQQLADYAYEDPAGAALNLSTVAGLAGKAAELSGVAQTAAQLGKVSEYTNPVTQAHRMMQAPLNAVSKTKIPEELYARVMKIPPGSLNAEQRTNVLKTLVRDEGLPLNNKTLAVMNSKIQGLENNIQQVINDASAAGGTVDVNRAISALDRMKSVYARRRNPAPYNRAIERVKDDLIEHDFMQRVAVQQPVYGPVSVTPIGYQTKHVPTGKMDIADAHALKKGIYEEIQDYYAQRQKPETGRVGIRNKVDAAASAEAAKVIRDEIMNNPLVPESARTQLATQAGLMNARKWVERATNRTGNIDVVSLSGMMFGVLVEKGLPAAAAYRFVTMPSVMSRLAIKMAKARVPINPAIPNALFQATQVPGGEQ